MSYEGYGVERQESISLHGNEIDMLINETPGAAEEIEELQQRKEAIMQELQEDLERLDAEGEVGDSQSMRQITYNGSKRRLMMYGPTGNREPVRAGALTVSSTMWGESYYMGTEVPDEKKRSYLMERAQYRVDELYDQQIAAAEIVRWYTNNEKRSDAYAMIREHFEKPETMEDGHIAEKMVESFLTKLSLDFDVPYEVESVNVIDDVEYRIDFLLKPKQPTKNFKQDTAVAVADAPEIGIQFTTTKKKALIEHKEAQISGAKKNLAYTEARHVDDIILVKIPLKNTRRIYDEWQNTHPHLRTPGGPDELWDIATKGQVYAGTLKQLIKRTQVSKEEAVAGWNAFQRSL